MSKLLSSTWMQRLGHYKQLYLGFSGGLDSSVLLALLAACPDLRSRIIVIHVHHGLSPQADRWLLHCEQRSQALGLAFIARRVAVTPGANLEERARLARYQVFHDLLTPQDALLLAHHQQDQAETLLLNLLRGAGIDGLAAMPEQRPCGQGVVLRPLLAHPREALKDYALSQALQWIEDESNDSTEWSRAYLRHQVLPLLRAKWPGALTTIAASATHCQQAKRNLAALAIADGGALTALTLSLTPALLADTDRLSNLLRAWLQHHLPRLPSADRMRHLVEELIFAGADATPCAHIDGVSIRRYRQKLYLIKDEIIPLESQLWVNFPAPLTWPSGLTIEARLDSQGLFIGSNARVEIRFRQGGECFHWHGQTKCLKKLFQAWEIPPWQRTQIPLLYVDHHLVAVLGYAVTDQIIAEGSGECYSIL